MQENKFGRKFTDEERKLIAELYPTHSKKQISEIIGKELTSGALQKIKRAFGITTKPYDEGKKIIQEKGDEIKRLAEEGWNNEDICKKLGIPLKTKYLFYKYIDGFSCGAYKRANPDVQLQIVDDYKNNLLSVYDIEKKYEIDTHGVQDILKKHNVLRNFRETRKLKRVAGMKIIKNGLHVPFTNYLKDLVRENYNNKCQICESKQSANGDKLHVHHIFPYRFCRKNEFHNLIPLCDECHKYVHRNMNSKSELLTQIEDMYTTNMASLSNLFLLMFKSK